MDLHLVPGAEPTAAERAALDGVLGPARDGWDGGARLSGPEGNTACGGHAARERRHLLLPALWALQEHIGWISPGGLNELCRRLTIPPADAYGVATFYAMLAVEPRPARVVHVCEDIACRCNGSDELIAQLEERFGGEGELSADGSATWYRSPCLGQCDRAPAALVGDAGDAPHERTIAPAVGVARARGARGRRARATARSPCCRRRATPRCASCAARRTAIAVRLDDYRASGGYEALRRAVELGPEGVIRELKDSKLQGRGGAAFPTGVKWEAVARQPVRPHYLVCNADESEPGTFKDRVLMELDPFALIEAMTIAAYATGCERGYLYIRGEYPEPQHALEHALDEARARGFLGDDVIGEGFAFDDRDPQGRRRLHLRRGDGDLRVDRGQPRRAAQQAAVPGRRTGSSASRRSSTTSRRSSTCSTSSRAPAPSTPRPAPRSRRARSSSASPATSSARASTRCRSGRRCGSCSSSPAGSPAGGRSRPCSWAAPRVASCGPTSSTCRSRSRPPARRRPRSARASSSCSTRPSTCRGCCMRLAAFFRNESCGQCVPCRVGTVRQQEALARLVSGKTIGGVERELAVIAEVGQCMRDASICGLGQTASSAIESAIERLGVF